MTDHIRCARQVIEVAALRWTFEHGLCDAARQALAMLCHEEDDQMEHSQYRHFLSRALEGVDGVVLPTGGHDHVGYLLDQVKLTHALNKELEQAMKDIHQFCDQGAKASQRIIELEYLYKQHEEAIAKLKQENTSLELGIQSCDELILQIAAEMGLDKMGQNDSEEEEEDDNEGDAAAPATRPAVAAKVDAEEVEDPDMLIPE
jgi:hypothetical protein